MTVFNITDKTSAESSALPENIESAELFIVCRAEETRSLLNVFGWDESAILECANLDETVRYTSYDGYDFTSVIYMDNENGIVSQKELNIFFAKKILTLVMPASAGERLLRLEERVRKAVNGAANRNSPLVYLYYSIFSGLAADFSETLELLEDEIESLAEMIVVKPYKEHIAEIGRLRKTAYTYKKLLRALSYIGGQIVIDENKRFDNKNARYFRNMDARLMKLYDFSESLYDLSNDLLHTYDSKFSVQMNETVNKLAAITLIFGPLTVIAGIYGMNFRFMPELQWYFGYPLAIGLMAVVALVIFLIMKKQKWL